MKRVIPFALSIAIASAACACNIPVFRYALERWRVDRSDVVVFHQGSLDAEQESLLKTVREDYADRYENISIIQSDLSSEPADHRELWKMVASDAEGMLPYVVLRSKLGFGRVVNVWHGPLDALVEKQVLVSPARGELSRRLLSGHAIVWLLIGSHDDKRNEQARKMLEANLETLAGKIELPDGIGLPGSELHSEIPLLLRFSLLEIDRNDPRESFLVDMLSRFQPQAVDEGEPLIVPVFGRGRALEVIPAGDLNDHLLEDLTVFLSGACSCQVKERNPGFDLLLSVDWNTELFGEGVEPPREKTTGDRGKPILLTIPPGQ